MSHFKHANEWFPGDQVKETGTKTASETTGSIVEVDPEMGVALIKFADGTTRHIAVEKLERV